MTPVSSLTTTRTTRRRTPLALATLVSVMDLLAMRRRGITSPISDEATSDEATAD